MTLVVRDLAKHYAQVPVFEQVSLSVAPGEFVAIVGESGVGKSTLLNCMAGLDHWDAGRIEHDGTDLGTLDGTARALWRRAHVGFVFQAFHVLPHLDVEQNVALPLMLQGRRDDARVARMLEAVGLQGMGTRLPQQLSGGQLQRVAIARALVHRPPLLLADEPTGSLDFATGEQVMGLMFDLNRELGTTLVLVTHDRAIAAQCEHRITIEAGRVLQDA